MKRLNRAHRGKKGISFTVSSDKITETGIPLALTKT
jgi:hypothetical protein